MNQFAVLLTCFNRREKTLASLTALHAAYKKLGAGWQMAIYLTDDGSTDGTAQAVAEHFPKVNILQGNGSLYWAGGMRNSWKEAIKGNYDAYLLLNDDTNVTQNLFEEINKTNLYSLNQFGVEGIYVGTTIDSKTNKVTYGGSIFKNRFLGTIQRIPLNNEKPETCELGNANIMWVSKQALEKIGPLSEGYVHGMADYDYTMKAVKKGVPVLILPGISGKCINDHGEIYERFIKLGFKERVKFLYNPVGLDFTSQLHHMRKHFPLRFPIFYLVGWFKVLFPKLYFKRLYGSRVKN